MAAEPSGNTVIIELGLERGEPDTYTTPTRSTVPDWFGPLLAAVLVLFCSAASAAPPPPPLSTLLSLRVGPIDSYALTDNGQLLAHTLGKLSLYDLTSGTLRWRSDSAAPVYRLRTGGGLVLLRPWSAGLSGYGDPGTTAISLVNGTARWRRSGSVVTVDGSSALLAVSGVRTFAGPGRRVQGAVDAVDPGTGQTRWQVNVPSTAVLLGVPGPRGAPARMLLVHDDRTAVVHDLATGRRLAEGRFPPADYSPDNPTVSGGLVLLRHPGERGTEVSAYDPVTLGLLWSRPALDVEEIVVCGPLACLIGADGVRALDPASGVLRWYRPGWRMVEQRGDVLLAYTAPASTAEAVGIVDPATGRVLVDLRGWRPLTGTGGGDQMLVTRIVAAGARTMVAVAAPGGDRPRPLAELPAGTGDCQAAPGRLVCRSLTGELVVWAYRQKG
jgi:outer membrane protein assembly factor BamB